MATLVTRGDRLLTTAGRESWLKRGSVPLAMFGHGSIPLVGDNNPMLSFQSAYETQPWIFAAVNKLNRGIMDLPIRLYRELEGGEAQPIFQHPAMDLLRRPWRRGSAAHLKQKMSFPALIHGNSLLGKVRPEANAAPTELVALDWRFLTAHTLEDGEVIFWETTQPNRAQFWAPEDVVHFAFDAGNGSIGVSPLKPLARTVHTEDAAQRYQAASFANGNRPSGAIVVPGDVKEDALERMKAAVRNAHGGGPDQQFNIALLTGGADWKPFSHTAVEAELIEQRKLDREEIAAAYDVDPPLIGILDHATYSNVAEMHNRFYRATLRPWLTMLTDTLNAQLLETEPAWRDENLFFAFDLSDVLRSDTPEEIAAVVTAINGSVMTPNEGRGRLRMRQSPNPAADELYMAHNNMQPLGQAPPDDPSAPPTEADPVREEQPTANGADPVKANLLRAMERAAKRMSAGLEPWDRDRFTRELAEDVPNAPADPLADLVEQWISQADGDPAECRRLARRI